MILTEEEKEALDGAHGEAVRVAMSVLRDLGEIFGASRMIPVSQVHIDTTLYMVEAGVEFAEKMANLGGRFCVPATLNPSSIDLLHWEEYRTPPELLRHSRRIENAYRRMGAVPTWTCTPYQHGLIPRFGQHIAWGESNAIAFANSVLGSRTNRCADLMDICAAVTGKVPEFGLHLPENRRADLLIRLTDIPEGLYEETGLYPVLGYLTGEIAGDRVVAIEGLPTQVPVMNLKSFGAAAASTGAVGLFHLIGITPEAHTREMCFHGRLPEIVVDVSLSRLRETAGKLASYHVSEVDWIVMGCPHFSWEEFHRLTSLLQNRKIHSSAAFWVYTSRQVYGWIESSGMLQDLANCGVRVFTDGCPLQIPRGSWEFNAVMSDSAKMAAYCVSQTGLPCVLASMEDCVETAVTGRLLRRNRWVI